ncbi:MAG: plastocyanin/azurin family copper-binding protein [Halosimplex sp.]
MAGLAGGGAAAATDSVTAQETETETDGGTATAGRAESGTSTGDGAADGGEPDFSGRFDDVGNFEGTVVDPRGEAPPQVSVGVKANGGYFEYGPPAIHVENGDTVRWTWTGQGRVGQGCPHNVVEEDGVFDSANRAVGGSAPSGTRSRKTESTGISANPIDSSE